jgi:hypothetical protein
MDLIEFEDTLYGKLKGNYFVWDSCWESFRPIDSIGWNGTTITWSATSYTKHIFDEWYGFGTSEMKEICKYLTSNVELPNARKITDIWSWYTKESFWWRDRKCCLLNSCVPNSLSSWKSYINYTHSSRRTIKQKLINRATKRLLPK